jgi:hypothetical protein
MIIVNGCPKSGTHAVMSMLSKMGLSRVCPTVYSAAQARSFDALDHTHYVAGHIPAPLSSLGEEALSGFLVFTIFRDPRNVLTSYCRFRKKIDDLDLSIANSLKDFWGHEFVPYYRSFLGWREPGRCIVLRYEDLPLHQMGDGSTLYSDQKWNTYTGSPSNWEVMWSDADCDAFDRAGGRELVEEAGYGI